MINEMVKYLLTTGLWARSTQCVCMYCIETCTKWMCIVYAFYVMFALGCTVCMCVRLQKS